jgi:putative tryptophan/tyrosine transport system substrate-binding protein
MRRGAPRRRLVLAAAGASLLPLTAWAQLAKQRRIGILAQGSRAFGAVNWEAFWQGLRVLGYGDQELAIENRWADGHLERLPGLAAELVRFAPEVIVAGSLPAAQAAKRATATIPIVVTAANDPVGAGLVASIAHPGGNVTGLSTMHEDIAGKQLELLKIAVPRAERIAVLVDPGNPSHAGVLQAVQQAARTSRTELLSIEVRAPDEIDGAFATVAREHADALVVLGGPLAMQQRSRIAELAARHKVPAIYYERELVAVGGLMSYGADLKDMYRRAATYVDKILKGAKPADLPIEQPTKFELVVNLKTAKALGVTIPPAILARADEVIE